jgi:hypothetical protein
MKKKYLLLLSLSLILLNTSGLLLSQSKGVKMITEKDLRYHLEFLGSREFRGRETHSPELDIATLYLANWARDAGLKPIMPDGSFYQNLPVTVTSVFQPGTRITLSGTGGQKVWYWSGGFGGNFQECGSYSGEVVFAGALAGDPDRARDALMNTDLQGRIVIILDALYPGKKLPTGPYYYYRLNEVISMLRDRGAAAVLSVVSPEREAKLQTGFNIFDDIPSGKMGILFDSQKTEFGISSSKSHQNGRLQAPFEQVEISHEVAADILGISVRDISELFRKAEDGETLSLKEVKGTRVQLDVTVETRKVFTRNVIAVVEGSDPVLKNEYVVVCGHPDGLGLREGEVLPGSDDNCTATVALIEIGKALLREHPKRSVILGWFTGEEKIMNGSHYFINNCPVPVEKISACLDMDMLGRNRTDSLFLVCSDLLSTELDGSIHKVNKSSGINFGFDYRYSNLTNPQQVYFRSDHYPFVRFGIPSVWFFSGFTPDYHTPRDGTESINYEKFCRITRLVYLTAFDVGNKKALLKLDVNPNVTARGKQNLTEPSLYKYSGQ